MPLSYLALSKFRLSVAALMLLALVPASVFAQTSKPPESLQFKKIIERSIKGGETNVFQFQLNKGQFAQAEIEQEKIEVAVSLFAPDGELIIKMDGKTPNLWLEVVSCIAKTSGVYRIEIKTYGSSESVGSYKIKLVELRNTLLDDIKQLKAEAHLSKGRSLNSQNGENLPQVVQEYESAARLWHELGNSQWMAVALTNLGWAYFDSSNYEQAITAHSQALNLFQTTKDRTGQSVVTNGLGYFYFYLKQYDKAKDSYELSLKIKRELGDERGEGKTLMFLGNVYKGLNQIDKAKDYYQQAITLTRKNKDLQGEGYSLMSLGHIYYLLSQFEQAKNTYEQSLIPIRVIKDQYIELRILSNLAGVCESLAQFEKAKDYYEQALFISRSLKDRSSEGEILTGLGNVYEELSQYEKSENYYEQSLTFSRENKNRLSESAVLNNLGYLYQSQKQFEKAKVYFENSLAIKREIKDRQGEAYTLGGLGSVYLSLGQFEKAKDYYEQTIKIKREIKDRNGEASSLSNLGLVYSNLNQIENAKRAFEQALVIKREFEDRNGEATIYWNLSSLSQQLKNSELAIFYGKQAVNIYQLIRGSIKGLDKEIQQSYLADKISIYRRLADILISKGRIPEAQGVLDLLKEEEFEGLVRRSGNAESIPYNNTELKSLEVLNNLAAIGREYNQLLTKNDQGTLDDAEKLRLKQLMSDLQIGNDEYQKTLADLQSQAKNSQSYQIVSKDAMALREDLRELGEGTVALYTVIDAEENVSGKTSENKTKFGWIILVTPDFTKAYPIDTKELELTVAKFRTALSNPKYDPEPLAKEMYKKIFLQTGKTETTLAADLETYLKDKKDKTLMWSLDGVLRYVPMAALHDGNSYLVEKYRNVVFNTASKSRLKDAVKQNWTILGLGVSEERHENNLTFPALSGVDSELAKVVKDKNSTTGILAGIVKKNKDFTRDAMIDALLFSKPPVVHIASHFSFQTADFNESFLLLGEGRWTVAEMNKETNLFRNVDLITLSACDTAMGQANGKDAEGFAYLAQSLGAKAVMASLWQVDDIGTQVLMPEFYRLHETGLGKAEALRQAQLSLLNGKLANTVNSVKRAELVGTGAEQFKIELYNSAGKPPFAHPYYWSPFILIGNWK